MRKLFALCLLALSAACSPCAPVALDPGADAPASTSTADLPDESTGAEACDSSSSGSSGAPVASPAPAPAPSAPPVDLGMPPAVEVRVSGGPMRAAK